MTPISTTPSVPPSTAVGESTGGARSGATEAELAGFAALVGRLVDAHAQPTRPTAGAPAGQPTSPGAASANATVIPAPASPEDAEAEPGDPGAIALPPTLVVPGQPAPVVTVTSGGPGAAATAGMEPAGSVGAMPVGAAATGSAVPGGVPAADVSLVDGPAPDPTATGAAAPPVAAEPATAPTTAPPPQAMSPVPTSAAASGAVDGGSPTQAAPPTPTQQVLPEMARLVSRGNGTHRLTLTLQPEVLGEVRITLTVRNGEVHVRLAAGEHAQHALREGTPELQHVLQLAGATDTRVVVRDLPTTPPPAASAAQASTTAYDARAGHGAAGHGRGDTDAHHARTRGGSFARDGADDGAAPLRPDPVRPARATGLDLTM